MCVPPCTSRDKRSRACHADPGHMVSLGFPVTSECLSLRSSHQTWGGKSIEQGWESPPPLSTITLLASVQMDRTHRILSPGCCSQRCVNDITRLPGTTARVPFKEPLFHFTAPTFQEEALCAVSLLLCYTAPRATSRLPPSSVCLIENSIQLTSNTH